MGTNITYNGIELRNVLTKMFEQEPVRDPSDTDINFWKYTIAVSTVLYPFSGNEYNKIHGMVFKDNNVMRGVVNSHPALIMDKLKSELSQDRKAFSYAVDDKVILKTVVPNERDEGANHYDVNNGPKVKRCKVTQLNSAAFRLEFEIEVCKGCEDSQSARRVLGNRWSCADDINEHGRITRTWEGRLRIGYAQDAEQSIHLSRNLVVPPLSKGFRRKSMKFTGDANGLELHYVITDQQANDYANTTPPLPATIIRGRHTETVSHDSNNCVGHANLYVEGLPNAPKSALIEIGMQFLEQKLSIIRGRGKTHLILFYSVTDVVDPNVNAVEVSASVRHTWDKSIKKLASLGVSRVGEPIAWRSDSQYNPTPTAGSKLAYSMFCHLQSPCSEDHGIAGNPDQFLGDDTSLAKSFERPSGSQETSEADYEEVRSLSAQIQNIEQAKRFDHTTVPWYEFRSDTTTHTKTGYIGLPIAGGNESADSVQIIQLHRRISKRSVRIRAERIGAWPTTLKAKNFKADGKTFTLIDMTIVAKNAVLAANGEDYLYSIEFDSEFIASKGYEADEPITIFGNPIENGDTLEKKILAQSFVDFES